MINFKNTYRKIQLASISDDVSVAEYAMYKKIKELIGNECYLVTKTDINYFQLIGTNEIPILASSESHIWINYDVFCDDRNGDMEITCILYFLKKYFKHFESGNEFQNRHFSYEKNWPSNLDMYKQESAFNVEIFKF